MCLKDMVRPLLLLFVETKHTAISFRASISGYTYKHGPGSAALPICEPESPRGHALHRFELTMKIGEVVIARLVRDVGDRAVAADQKRRRVADPQLRHIVRHAHMRMPPEQP